MARHPTPGRVKTRLAATLGDTTACRLYTAFLLDLGDRLRATGLPVTWAHWPADAPFATLVAGDRCLPQRGADLGERMANAVADVLGGDRRPVVVLGVDAPHLPVDAVLGAVAALDAGEADVAVGPAADGGYWAIAVRKPCPALFAGVAWGTDRVLAETLARAARLGLRVHRLPTTFDVDDAAGVAALRAAVAAGAVVLPRTAAVLAAIPP